MTLSDGVDVEIVDEPVDVQAPTQTDPLYLVHSPARVRAGRYDLTSAAEARDLLEGETDIIALTDTAFAEGDATVHLSTLDEAERAPLDVALERFTNDDDGPGQLCAPECITPSAHAQLAEHGWTHNRVAMLDCADGASDETLIESRDLVQTGMGSGRFAALFSDTLIVPGLAPGQTREVPSSIVAAALAARNDIATGNPNLTAAGVQGICRYVIGLKTDRTEAQRRNLAEEQINTFRTYLGQIRGNSWLTLADLERFPHWWDLNGSRVMMAARAIEQAVAEDFRHRQIDADKGFLTQYEGALRAGLAELRRAGALWGYSVDVGEGLNPVRELAAGHVVSRIGVQSAPHARSLVVQIVRRRIDQEL